MKTDELIRVLAADASRPVVPVGQLLYKALALGAMLSVGLFLGTLHPRGDLRQAVATEPFVYKLLVVLVLTGAAASLLSEAARPFHTRRAWWSLAVPPLLLGAGVIAELCTVPSDAWMARLIGHNARHCVSLIPLLSLPLLVCLLATLRRGAPRRPAAAGALAGLVSGGFGALLYALTCPDDSPLFVATWYPAGIAIVTAAAACIGRRTLRW